MTEPRRIVDIADAWAEREPERVCLTFHPGGRPAVPVTYGALRADVLAWARGLARLAIPPGAPVVVLARSAPGFVAAFLAAQRADLLAIPCPPPDPLEPSGRVQERVAAILGRSGATVLVDPTPGPETADLPAALGRRGLRVVDPSSIQDAEGEAAPRRAPAGTFAYCQFTSGSGGRAKGVRLTHENLLASIRARTEAYDLGESDVGVSWLPLFHDMGLVGYVLHPLVTGLPVHLMPTTAFLARPGAWLALIARVRGTMSVAPNSAYGLCARRVTDAEVAELDLSCWRLAFNGSEPVTREVVDAFTRRLAPAGFRASAMLPAYGLAENTLTATARRPGEGVRIEEVSRDALEVAHEARAAAAGEARRTVVSVGRPLPGQEVRVVDADGTPVGAHRVGEVHLRGPSVMHSYLPGTEGEAALRTDGWLATGDLGFMADGELFLVGRKKDLIIRGGRNYYAEDLEDAAARVPGIRPGRLAAFSLPGAEQEQVVLVAEARPDPDRDPAALRETIAQAVFQAVRWRPDDVVLLDPHALPLTSSGKVMRPEARRRYETGAWSQTPI